MRREVAFQIRPHLTFRQDITLEQVIEAARQLEENNKVYPESLAGFQSPHFNTPLVVSTYTPPPPQTATVEEAVSKALTPLIKAMEQLVLSQGNKNENKS